MLVYPPKPLNLQTSYFIQLKKDGNTCLKHFLLQRLKKWITKINIPKRTFLCLRGRPPPENWTIGKKCESFSKSSNLLINYFRKNICITLKRSPRWFRSLETLNCHLLWVWFWGCNHYYLLVGFGEGAIGGGEVSLVGWRCWRFLFPVFFWSKCDKRHYW